MEAEKKRLAGDTMREANTGDVQGLRREPRDLKEVVAEQAFEDKAPMPARVWNRIPDDVRKKASRQR